MFKDLLKTAPWPQQQGTRTAIGPFSGCAETECIAQLAAAGQLLVVITADTNSALTLERELPFFLRDATPILTFPDWETLPYDSFSPHQDIISGRLSTLYELPGLTEGILIVPVSTLMHRLPPTQYVAGNSLVLQLGQTITPAAFRSNLQFNGYRNVDTVYEHGEFAFRGSLIDIFPMGSTLPYRIDLLDDDVESLRTFDPETQRTIEKVESINMLPAREYPLDAEAIERFKMRWYDEFDGDPDLCPMFTEVSAGRSPGGSEYYLPLFFDSCASLFDYLPDSTRVITSGEHHAAAKHFWQECERRYTEYGIDPRRPLLPPEKCFTRVEEFYRQLKDYAVLELRENAQAVHVHTDVQTPPTLATEGAGKTPAQALKSFLDDHQGRALLCAESAGRREILLESLQTVDLAPDEVANWQDFLESDHALAISTAPLDRGLYSGNNAATLITESQLFGGKIAQRRRRKATPDSAISNIFRDLSELRPGVPVVHLEHGIGRYVGLESLTVDGQIAEFLTLEYADNARLYVPVASLHLISRYSGSDPDLAPIHRLGSEQWEKARRKASERAQDVASQLLEVYARRESREGFEFELEDVEYNAFSSAFPFEETPDQEQTIAAVIQDMQAPRSWIDWFVATSASAKPRWP